MSVDKFTKHQRSRKKKFVATLEDGTEFQADTQEEITEMLRPTYEKQLAEAEAERRITEAEAEVGNE